MIRDNSLRGFTGHRPKIDHGVASFTPQTRSRARYMGKHYGLSVDVRSPSQIPTPSAFAFKEYTIGLSRLIGAPSWRRAKQTTCGD
jgi:hypothetical protein